MDERTLSEHTLTIEQRKKVTATQIISVDAFSDRQIILSYAGGRIVITGSGMKISGFSKSGGVFSASGEIISARYLSPALSLRRKLFK